MSAPAPRPRVENYWLSWSVFDIAHSLTWCYCNDRNKRIFIFLRLIQITDVLNLKNQELSVYNATAQFGQNHSLCEHLYLTFALEVPRTKCLTPALRENPKCVNLWRPMKIDTSCLILISSLAYIKLLLLKAHSRLNTFIQGMKMKHYFQSIVKNYCQQTSG